MRALAIVCAYNEVDILPWVVEHLFEQGVDVHVIDNASTDGTYEWVTDHKDERLSSARWPANGSSDRYNWTKLLEQVMLHARQCNYDWVMSYDADEIRRSPWPGVRLLEALERVQGEGFNAVNHRLVVFPPVDNGYDGKPEEYFKYCYPPTDDGTLHVKCWKNNGQKTDLSLTGGHKAWFNGIKIYPEKFIIKHYPIRTQEQGERKVFRERKNRWNKEERDSGWHVQYDRIVQGHNFVVPVADVVLYEGV